MEQRTHQAAFTLLEFLIGLGILVVLAAVAIPSYLHYQTQAYYSEVVQIADRYRAAVTSCIEQQKGKLVNCDGGRYGVPENIPTGSGVGQVNSVIVRRGVITVIPQASNGIKTSDTLILTPTYSADKITWTITGGGCKRGLVPAC